MQARRHLRLLTLWQPLPAPPALPADLRALAAANGLSVRVRAPR
jgi:hypothetical protein